MRTVRSVPAIKALAEKHIDDCLTKAAKYYGRDFILDEITFNRYGKVAGSVRTTRKGIPRRVTRVVLRLNPAFLITEFDNMFSQTIPHEVAHIVADDLSGEDANHGPVWKEVMVNCFGLEPDRCHDYDTSKIATASRPRFSYRCHCRTHQLTSIRHHKILRGTKRYHCTHCRAVLTRDTSVSISNQEKATMNAFLINLKTFEAQAFSSIEKAEKAGTKSGIDFDVVTDVSDLSARYTGKEMAAIFTAVTGTTKDRYRDKAKGAKEVIGVLESLPVDKKTAAAKPAAKSKATGDKKEYKKGAVRQVWDICDALRGKNTEFPKRATVLVACEKAGINLGTASTQFHQWKKAHA